MTYRFEAFALYCDLLADRGFTADEDGQAASGSVQQRENNLVLSVAYGSVATLDARLKLLQTDNSARVEVVDHRTPALLCGRSAERAMVKVTPPPPPIGTRRTAAGIEHFSSGFSEPYLLTLVGTVDSGVPIVATVQKPVRGARRVVTVERHFFESVRLTP
jgi:hypothetical protein